MRKHRYIRSILIYLVFLKFIQPAPMDIEEELLSDDLYNVSAGQHLWVATVANSRFFNPKDFPDSTDFMLLPFSKPQTTNFWMTLKGLRP